jgi:hypothetical protein
MQAMGEADQDVLESLVSALAGAKLSDTLKEARTADRIVAWLAAETRAPPWLVRVVYHWVLVVLAKRLEEAAESAVSAAAEGAARRLARLPGAKWVLGKFAVVAEGVAAAADAEAALDEFLGAPPEALGTDADLATTADRASVRVLAELRDWRDEYRDFAGDVSEMLLTVQESLNRQPPLETQTAPDIERSRFLYRSRHIPFVGREREFATLNDFLNDPHPFAWQLVTGGGGAGKSRLALEFCLSVGGLWRAGLLPRDRSFDDAWHDWNPVVPTLIVVDYVAERAAGTGAMVRALTPRALEWPVRMLLIERAKDDFWWKDFAGTPNEWAAMMEPSQFRAPVAIEPLQDASMRAIARSMGAPDPEDAVAKLAEIDPEQQRPLFLAVVADAMKAGTPLGGLDRTTLLREMLDREREHFWPKDLMPADERLLAFATMVGEQPTTLLRDAADTGLFPPPAKETIRRHHGMVGRSKDATLLPLEPDMLGELFVLDLFDAETRDGIAHSMARLRDMAWSAAGAPLAVAIMTERCARDFPTHRGFVPLSMPKVTDPQGRLLLALLSVGSINFVGKTGELAAARALYDRIEQIAEAHPDEPALREEQAKAAVNLIADYGTAGELAAARSMYDRVEKIAEAHAGEPALREEQARAAFNLIVDYGDAGDLAAARALYDRIEQIAEAPAGEPALREWQAKAAFNLIIDYGTAGELAAARALYDRIEQIAEAPAGEPALREWQANAALSLIVAYGNAGDADSAREIARRNAEYLLSDRFAAYLRDEFGADRGSEMLETIAELLRAHDGGGAPDSPAR